MQKSYIYACTYVMYVHMQDILYICKRLEARINTKNKTLIQDAYKNQLTFDFVLPLIWTLGSIFSAIGRPLICALVVESKMYTYIQYIPLIGLMYFLFICLTVIFFMCTHRGNKTNVYTTNRPSTLQIQFLWPLVALKCPFYTLGKKQILPEGWRERSVLVYELNLTVAGHQCRLLN